MKLNLPPEQLQRPHVGLRCDHCPYVAVAIDDTMPDAMVLGLRVLGMHLLAKHPSTAEGIEHELTRYVRAHLPTEVVSLLPLPLSVVVTRVMNLPLLVEKASRGDIQRIARRQEAERAVTKAEIAKTFFTPDPGDDGDDDE